MWNYDGGVPFKSEGSLTDGPCFLIAGRVTSSGFFNTLKRVSDDSGSVFLRGKETLTSFPDKVLVSFVIFDQPCDSNLEAATEKRSYLTREMMGKLHLAFYWKRGIELRSIDHVQPKYFSVDRVMPYAVALAHDLPERFEWSYAMEVPSGGVPLTDSLVLVLRAPDGHIAARLAARL